MTSIRQRKSYNPKRRIEPANDLKESNLKELAERATYEGSPQHKLRPNDYNLKPPHSPRPGKTLCDGTAQFPKALAEELLRKGLAIGMVSSQKRGPWHQNVWAVLDGVPFEAQLSDRERGTYHGYPMPADDDFRRLVLEEWERRSGK